MDLIGDPERLQGFMEGLWEILLEEAREDERRGRKILADRLRAAAAAIEAWEAPFPAV